MSKLFNLYTLNVFNSLCINYTTTKPLRKPKVGYPLFFIYIFILTISIEIDFGPIHKVSPLFFFFLKKKTKQLQGTTLCGYTIFYSTGP